MLLVQYWDTEDVPNYLAAWFASFREHNPGLDHRIFNQVSAETFIASNFTQREVTAFRACAVPSMQSDYFRYCAVLTFGGVYSDADIRCVGSLTTLLDATEGGTVFAKPNGNVNCNFFAFRSAGHPFLRLALDIATARIERRDPKDSAWLATGPAIPTYMHRLFQAGSIEAFIRQSKGGKHRDYPEFLAEVVGEYSQIKRAFEGIRVLSFEDRKAWVVGTGRWALWKQTSVHWTKRRGSLFR